MSKTFLVAVDFEAASRRAIDLAKEFGKALGAELVLMHAYEMPVYAYPGLDAAILPSYSTELLSAARDALAELGREVLVTRQVLREGDPADEICRAAHDVEASLIVMGTHGRRGVAHALLGSVAERVVRTSDIPVLTARAGGK